MWLRLVELVILNYPSSFFTWDNQRISFEKVACKIDRVMVDDKWREAFEN